MGTQESGLTQLRDRTGRPVDKPRRVRRKVRRWWRLPDDGRRERRAILLVVFVGPPAFASATAGVGPPPLVIGAAAALIAITLNAVIVVRRIPRLVISGLVGGGAAGFVAIGAGSRLAMRIVALTGGRREVTIEGTMFLLVAGAVVGAFLGPGIAAMQRIWEVRGSLLGVVLAVFPGGGLLLDTELRAELLHEGAGGWLNIPLFYAIFPLYGILVVRTTRRVNELLPMPPGRELTTAGDPPRRPRAPVWWGPM